MIESDESIVVEISQMKEKDVSIFTSDLKQNNDVIDKATLLLEYFYAPILQ